jgi:8-amino-7-oxononanoate synthase
MTPIAAPIAIVGMDVRAPGAPNLDALWRMLLSGEEGITEVPAGRWSAADFHDPAGGPGTTNTRNGGFLDDADAFDHEFFAISPREAAAMDPQQRLLLQATWRALEDATLDPRSMTGSATGVWVGVMANEWATLQLSDYARITPQLGSGNGYFMTANRISYQLGLTGPSMAVDTACSSSLVAVQMACAALRAGECDQALAAGVNLVLTPALTVFYTQAGLSAPDGRCKPFSAAADGIGRGECVGVIVLRRLADAQAEGLPIYAVIEGGAVNSDGRSNGITAPSRWAQQRVLEDAYRNAGVRADQIDFIEAHGTGTVLGDMIETKALGAVHKGGRSVPCPIGSIKGNLGHTEGAAGIAGLIKVALSLHHGVVPPTRYADTVNPQLRLADQGLRLVDEPLPLPDGIVRAGVSSFGLGGTNAHVVLANAPARPATATDPAEGGGILTVSAPNRDGLRRAAARLAADIVEQPTTPLGALCRASNTIKASGRHRLALPATDRDAAVAALRAASTDDARFAELAGTAAATSIGWIFTGQGAQYPGMSRALDDASPLYRSALSDVDDALSPHLGRSVREVLFDAGDAIHRTELAQPAIFAVEYAIGQALLQLGVRPDWMLGHSVGEFAAATLAGALDLADAAMLICARGRLMQQLPSGGGMLAVRLDSAEELLAAEPALALAAVNGPQDVVLSGPVDALDRARRLLAEQGRPARLLTVSHAFHSPLMDPMLGPFAALAAGCTFREPDVPLYSTVRGRLLGVDEPMDAGYWTEHITATVRFADAVGAALDNDPTHVIEVGPRRVLAPLLARIRPESAVPTLTACPGPDACGTELDEVVAALYRDGFDPVWAALETSSSVRTRLSGYEFSTEHRSWVPAPGQRPLAHPTDAPPTAPTPETTMDQLIALFREQAAVLAAVAGNATGEPAAAVPPTVAAPVATVDPRQVAATVRAEAARICGFPTDRLLDTQTLTGDLGFDSIMLADLAGRLDKAFPGLAISAGGWSWETTLGELTDRLVGELCPAEPVPVAPVPVAPPAVPETVPPTQPRPEDYRVELFPEVTAIADRLRATEAHGLTNPYFLVNDGVTRDTSIIDGVPVVNFSSYNYLGMSGHPAITAAVQDAVARYGSSASSSRLLSGEKPVHHELEAELATLLGTDDAIVLTSGHATNVTVIGHLVGDGDLVIHDALAHNSIVEGATLSGATRRPFPHNDAAALHAILAATRHQYRRVLVVIEGAYSQDGDIADLPALIAVKKRHHALLMVDEAHSVGVLGATGGGIGEHFAVDRGDVELWSGTLSKSLASCGGYVAGRRELIQFLKYTTPGFIFSAAMTPPNAAAALAALREMRSDPEPLDLLRRNSALFPELATEAGIDTGASAGTPIIPCIVGDSTKTLALSNALLRRGVNVNPILYPAVPENEARLRFFVTSCHSPEQIRHTVKALAEELALLR